MIEKILKIMLKFTHYEKDKKIFKKEGLEMKKYSKEEIIDIVMEAQFEVTKEIHKNDKKMNLKGEKEQFINEIMNIKDMALLSAMAVAIEKRLR